MEIPLSDNETRNLFTISHRFLKETYEKGENKKIEKYKENPSFIANLF